MSSSPVPLDYVAAPIPLVGMTAETLDSLFRSATVRRLEIVRKQSEPIQVRCAKSPVCLRAQQPSSHWSRHVVFRQSLSADEGTGYWEFQRLSNDVVISWTKAEYKRDTWVDIPGPSSAFKIRLLLHGELSLPDSHLHMKGPSSMLSVYPVHSNNGYIVRGGINTELIVLHCRPSLLTNYPGVAVGDLPVPLKALNLPDGHPVSQFMLTIPNLQGTIRDLFQSRFRYSPPIQPLYLEARIQEILCNVLQDLANRHGGHPTKTGLQAPDVRRVREAQRILLQELVSPPQISALARRVGVSQTKLKANFKAFTGETIYSFVKLSRMERAAQLLLEGAATVSEVAYAVGYEYAANFTPVFKQHFGVSPRQWLLLQRCDY